MTRPAPDGDRAYLDSTVLALRADAALQSGTAADVKVAAAGTALSGGIRGWLAQGSAADSWVHRQMSRAHERLVDDRVSLEHPVISTSRDGAQVTVFGIDHEQFTTIDSSTGTIHAVPGEIDAPVAYRFTAGRRPTLISADTESDTVSPVVADAIVPTMQGSTSQRQSLSIPPAAVQTTGPARRAVAQRRTVNASGIRVANLARVAAWAYTNEPKQTITPFEDDCTDFASWALFNGGLQFQTYYKQHFFTRTNDHDWFNSGVDQNSKSWSFAVDNFDWQVDQNAEFMPYWNAASVGDLIWANWSGGPASGISHMGIVTQAYGSNLYITQHSPGQRNVPLWRIPKTLAWQGKNPKVKVWIARPSQDTSPNE